MTEPEESEATYAEVSMAKESFGIKENECYGNVKVVHNNTVDGNNKRIGIVLVVAVVLVVVPILATCIAFAIEISKLKSESVSAERLERLLSIAEKNRNTLESLHNDTNEQISSLNSSLEEQTGQLRETLRTRLVSIIPVSCASLPPSFPSDYYWVSSSNGSAVRVYCDMTRSCGGVTGGWTRVAELDMTNSSHQCPSGLRQRTDSNSHIGSTIHTCVSSSPSPGCSSDIVLNKHNISFTRVCGRIIGYQIGATNAFASQRNNISVDYVDGVSLTHGDPRQHIWTFAAARDETTMGDLESKCPCILGGSAAALGNGPPAFVGNDYFCDTGSSSTLITHGDLIGEDPLWDGAGCGTASRCCSFNTPPWFYKQLPQPTTDNIQMRMCRDEHARYEDVGIEAIEIYIQ